MDVVSVMAAYLPVLLVRTA